MVRSHGDWVCTRRVWAPGQGTLNDSGTSMATPMTAGIAALVKQAHPGWDGKQIKAAIMNTADASLNAS